MVSGEVSSEGTSSTSWSTGTGLKKCTPITWVGREVTTPSFMIGIDEVLDARIASGAATTVSSRRNRSTLAVSSSTIASTTTSRSASASRSVTTRIRASTSAAESILPLQLGALQRLLEPAERGLRRVLARLDDDHVLAGARADLGDAGPHQAATDHTHVVHDPPRTGWEDSTSASSAAVRRVRSVGRCGTRSTAPARPRRRRRRRAFSRSAGCPPGGPPWRSARAR